MSTAPPVLLFDGDCAFCTTCATWMQRHIRRLDSAVPYQFAELDALGVTAADCERALQWVGTDGTVLSAHLAVAQVLVGAGRGWAVIGHAIRLPGIRWISGLVYRWVARNRHRLPGGMPACAVDPHRKSGAR